MSADDDFDGRGKPADAVLAAELALGLLDASGHARAQARAAGDDAFAAAAADWTRRLRPLLETVAPLAPSPGLWTRIEGQVHAAAPPAPRSPAQAFPPEPPTEPARRSPSPSPSPLPPRPRRLALWRAAAFAGFALAAASLVAAGVEARRKVTWSPLLAAKLAPGPGAPALVASEPLFAATVDRSRGVVILTPISPGPFDPRVRELWLTPRAGAPPIAVGVIAPSGAHPMRLPPEALKSSQPGATLSVSLEPAGGSRAERPTGPVIATGALGRI